ncbi:hypothetical protein PRZ48_002737 [Zasmidium cellare]|uniref:RNA-dependent RNA polymerase n=1 Tax=Zasmidium cellare TaxID=395010 RepID=A0ABR0EU31_ZASCE|nr:hypothetical protein PRZ48_002737 [Zasmidium cellare]
MVPRTTTPNARAHHQQLSHDIAQFACDAGITLPLDDLQSPTKEQTGLRYKIVRIYRLLWWKNKPALEDAINHFFRSLPSTPNSTSESVKLELILDRLNGPAEMTKIQCTTPSTTRIVKDAFEPTQADEPPSPSPTPARLKGKGIKGHFTATKSGAKAPQLDDITPPSAKPFKPPPAADTSFTTTATKSFGRSFQSSFGGPATQDTAATSFSSIAPSGGRRESNYLSSLSTTEAGELLDKLEEAESSQKSKATDRTARPALSRPTLPPFSNSSQSLRDTETTWGSSIDTSVYEAGQKNVDEFIANGYHWQKRDSGVVSEDEFVTADERHESPKRQRLRSPTPELMKQARFKPARDFAQLLLPAMFSNLPFHLQWEAQRLLQGGLVTPQKLQEQWQSHSLRELYDIAQQQGKPFHKSFDADNEHFPDFEELTFTGKFQFAVSGNGVLFNLMLQPPTKGRTSDLQRQFGCDRIMYVDIPDLNKPPEFLKGRNLIDKFEKMAKTPQTFLGRRWIQLLIKPHKRKKKPLSRTAKPDAFRILFFAVDDGIKIPEVIHYMIPFHENAGQTARKLYSRLELFTSSSTAGITFTPEDIAFGVQDQIATSDPSDTRFLDPALRNDFKEPRVSKREMSDGCREISHYAMCKIAEVLGCAELPSAVQGRIAGSKGIWYRKPDPNYYGKSDKPPGPHIWIAKTQIKVKRDSLFGCDSGTLTLNVKKPNSMARSSLAHMGFLPILEDRGVPRENIFDVTRSNMRDHSDELEVALTSPSPMPMRRWMHQRNELWEERGRDTGIQTVGDFPKSREEAIIMLLEAGFVPSQDAFLAREINMMITDMLNVERKKFKIPLAASTTLTGIADPEGCLEPGEIHVHFSPSFKDRVSGELRTIMHKMEGLIARNPAMAPWDMQRVRIVFRPELHYLPNMVILSAKGKRPLAELLQGGDYDGDTFWVTWDQRLVSQFKNAPAPWDPPSPEYFGIKTDDRRLHNFVTDPESEVEWCNFLGEMSAARLRPDLLGTVTLLHERVTYMQGCIDSKQALYLTHLHDRLVDADKQGYIFTHADLEHFKRKIGLPKNLPTPRHWKYTKMNEENDDVTAVGTRAVHGNIIDDIFSKVIQPAVDQTLHRVNEILRVATHPDPHLTKLFDETWNSAGKGSIERQELAALEDKFQPMRDIWITHQKVWHFDDLVTRLRAQYVQIKPTNQSDPLMIEWMRREGFKLTTWERLKASAFAKWQYRGTSPGKFVFSIAGRELCHLKVDQVGQSRPITEEAWCNMKINKRPRHVDVGLGDDEGDEDDDAGMFAKPDDQRPPPPTGETGYY